MFYSFALSIVLILLIATNSSIIIDRKKT